MKAYDLVIIGTGMGGGTLAYALRNLGRKVLLLERGDYLPSEPENWVMSEDLPDLENQVTLGPAGRIEVRYRPNNLRAHNRLIQAGTQMLKRAGFPMVFIQRMGIETNSHQCGTLRFGTDPTRSVLDPFCRSHDLPNLFVVDGSFFPSSSAVNPALTIAAQSLRVADHIEGRSVRSSQN